MAPSGKTSPSAKKGALLFGTGGVPHSSKLRSTVGGIERIRELGLDCMELEFVHQVKMGEATAKEVNEAARSNKVRLTVHAPYYINFNSSEPDKVKASQSRLLQTARVGSMCGVESVAFHAAFYGGNDPEDVYQRVKACLSEVLGELEKEKIKIWIRPEVMGRDSQFGTIDEAIRLSLDFEQVLPAVDVAHWHARAGKFNTYDEFIAVFKQIEDKLGRRGIENMHVHFSGIRYGKSGEISHLNLKDSDFQYRELLRAFKDVGARGLIICESPNLEEDALLLKSTYRALTR